MASDDVLMDRAKGAGAVKIGDYLTVINEGESYLFSAAEAALLDPADWKESKRKPKDETPAAPTTQRVQEAEHGGSV